MLVLTIILTAVSGGVIILEKINPYHGFLSLFNGKFSLISIIVLIIIIGISLIIYRPWCKYLCPYGALLGLFNKIKVFRVVRRKSTCIGCKKCSRSCPMNIEVSEKEEVRDLHCISCFECVEEKVCPKQHTIYLSSKDEIDDENENNNKSTSVSTSTSHNTVKSLDDMEEKEKHHDHKKKGNKHGEGGHKGTASLESTESIDMASGSYEDGTYEGTANGYSNNLKVQVQVSGGKISDIEILSHNETPGFCEKAFEQVPASIIQKQSTDVDTVSGATYTSKGIINAVNNALNNN